MSYSLEAFCTEVRETLRRNDDRTGHEEVRVLLERLLAEPSFCSAYVGSDDTSGMRQIYADPELGFCLLAYNMTEPRTSPPHDHARSWAVYGQAAGHPDMTIWSAGADVDNGDVGVEVTDTFRLEAGQAGLFDVREIHSIAYTSGAKFVRVTGVDMSTESRRVYDPDEGTVRTIESAGTK